MSTHATTVHQLFGLGLAPSRDLEPKDIKLLSKKFGKGLCLLVIDEFTMVSRAMMGIVLDRLRAAHIDMQSIGIIMIGDPAQLLPIGGEPCWSISSKRMDGKNFSDNSILGLTDFRDAFGMPKLSTIPNYVVYEKNRRTKHPTESQRKQISEFIACALQGTYDAVYLTEVRRNIVGDEQSDFFTKTILPRCRYGQTTERDLLKLKEIYASKDEMEKDILFKKARIVQSYHYFQEDNPQRKNVESENIRRTFEFAKENDQAVVHLKAMHLPSEKAANLERLSGNNLKVLSKIS